MLQRALLLPAPLNQLPLSGLPHRKTLQIDTGRPDEKFEYLFENRLSFKKPANRLNKY